MQDIKVMVIDDSEIDREIFCYKLKIKGITNICEKKDGEEALSYFEELIRKDPVNADALPSLIFLDINMPKVDGFEFLNQFTEMISNVGFNPPMVVMHSSSDHIEEISQANEHSFVVDFLVKGKVDSEKLDHILSLASFQQKH